MIIGLANDWEDTSMQSMVVWSQSSHLLSLPDRRTLIDTSQKTNTLKESQSVWRASHCTRSLSSSQHRGPEDSSRGIEQVNNNTSSRKLTFITALVKKKLHLPNSPQTRANSSKSNNSPIGIPHPANNHSCKCHSNSAQGQTSKDLASPATAAISFSHRNSNSSREGSMPILSGLCVLYRSSSCARLESDMSAYWRR
jgi:hypothetical protein